MSEFEDGYRAGIEAAAVVVETGREELDPADGYRSTIMVDMDGDEIAAAIRALPVPEQGAAEPTEDEVERAAEAIFQTPPPQPPRALPFAAQPPAVRTACLAKARAALIAARSQP